jgi:hypothetical protein
MDDIVVRDGGDTENGFYHPGADDEDTMTEAIVGVHVGTDRCALHLSGIRMLSGESANHSDADWLNLSLDWYF